MKNMMGIIVLMKFLKKYKWYTIIFLVMVVSSIFFSLEKMDFISDSITCVSIIFAFSQASVLAIYGNYEINLFMKRKGILDSFIKDNSFYLRSSIVIIILLFFFKMVCFQKSFLQDKLHITEKHLALWIVFYLLLTAYEYVRRYMNVYKNTYNDRVLDKKDD